MHNFLNDLKYFLERIDYYRDEILFVFIKPYWPRKITPNHITWVRVCVSMLLFVLLFWLGIEIKVLIVTLFCFGAITDLIDGPVARGLNKVTEFGAMLDPIADRLLILPIAFYSLYNYHKWLLLILILMELLSAVTSIFHKSRETSVGSNIYGKTKMVLQSVVFVAILFLWPAPPSQFFIYLLWLTIPFSLLSTFARMLDLNSKGHIKNRIITKHLSKYNETQSKNI